MHTPQRMLVALALAALLAACPKATPYVQGDTVTPDVTADTGADGDTGVSACSVDDDCVGQLTLNGCQRPDCQNGQCVAVADTASEGAACTAAASLCTVGECQAGECINLATLDCSGLDDGICATGVCDESSGECQASYAAEGTDCAGALCQQATCDGAGTCNVAGVAAGAACSTGNPCLIDGVCNDAGACSEDWDQNNPDCACTADSDCDDGLNCTEDSCDAGVCTFTPYDATCAINGECHFKDAVNAADPCQVCLPALSKTTWSELTCDDGDVCTGDSCQAGVGCMYDAIAANGTACSDGPGCATEAKGTCDGGACLGCEVQCVLSSDCATATGVPELGPCQRYKCDEGSCIVQADPTLDGQACDTGDACLVGGLCAAGVCDGTPFDCAPARCQSATCSDNGSGPECMYGDAPAGDSCDDYDPCTEDDVCDGSGGCAGVQKDCSAFAVGQCVDGACFDGNCTAVPKTNGATCDLQSACSTGDTCQDGVCMAGQITCTCTTNTDCDDGKDCTFDVCNGGVCDNPVQQNSCLIDGTCYDAGTLSPTNVCLVCGAAPESWQTVKCDDDNPCTADTCDPTAGCSNTIDTAFSCNDGDPCTADDSCDATGACVGTCECDVDKPCEGAPPVCSQWQCINYSCVAVADPSLNGEGCDDGSFCTVQDTCQAGVCTGTARDCNAEVGSACLDGVCDDAAEGCIPVNKVDGTACDDGQPCTEADACTSGQCEGTVKDCSGLDDLPCAVGTCVAGDCVAEAQAGQPCDDGEPCTEDDACGLSGLCGGTYNGSLPGCACASDADCDGLADACNDGVCDAGTGQCTRVPKSVDPAPASCDDGNPCTQADVCDVLGECAGDAYSCEDGLTCTSDACDGLGGCDNALLTGFCLIDGVCRSDGESDPAAPCNACDAATSAIAWSANVGATCDDGDDCTNADICDGSGACAGTPYTCPDDGLPCTIDVCGPADDECLYPLGPNRCLIDAVCYNADVQDPTNACVACKPGTAVDGWTPIGGDCDDGEPCSFGDSCSNGGCTGQSYSCSDGKSCTDDVCDGLGGCTYQLLPSRCLIAGVCFTTNTLNPTNECELCDPAEDTTHWSGAQVGPCDDGLPCTTGEQCDGAGACVGTTACTPDTCEQTTCNSAQCEVVLKPGNCKIDGLCFADGEANPTDPCQVCDASAAPDAWTNGQGACDDGDACTLGDICVAGGCVGTPYVCDDDGLGCTNEVCDGAGGCDVEVDAGSCVIGGACYADGAVDPDNSCLTCDTASNPLTWSVRPDDTPCDGPSCTTNVCQAGTCTSTPDGASCFIGGACLADGATNPVSPCQVCDVAMPSAWTNLTDGTPCGTIGQCGGDQCLAGACASVVSDDFTPCDDGNADTYGDWCFQSACGGFELTTDNAADRYERAGVVDNGDIEQVVATYELTNANDLYTALFGGGSTPAQEVAVGGASGGGGAHGLWLDTIVAETSAFSFDPASDSWNAIPGITAGSDFSRVLRGEYATPLSQQVTTEHLFLTDGGQIQVCFDDAGSFSCANDGNLTALGAAAGWADVTGTVYLFDTSGGSLRALSEAPAPPVGQTAWTVTGLTDTGGRTAEAVAASGDWFVVVGENGLVVAGSAGDIVAGGAGQEVAIPGFTSQSITDFTAVAVWEGHAFAVGHAKTGGSTKVKTLYLVFAPMGPQIADPGSWRTSALTSASTFGNSKWLDDVLLTGVSGLGDGTTLYLFGGWRASQAANPNRSVWRFAP